MTASGRISSATNQNVLGASRTEVQNRWCFSALAVAVLMKLSPQHQGPILGQQDEAPTSKPIAAYADLKRANSSARASLVIRPVAPNSRFVSRSFAG